MSACDQVIWRKPLILHKDVLGSCVCKRVIWHQPLILHYRHAADKHEQKLGKMAPIMLLFEAVWDGESGRVVYMCLGSLAAGAPLSACSVGVRRNLLDLMARRVNANDYIKLMRCVSLRFPKTYVHLEKQLDHIDRVLAVVARDCTVLTVLNTMAAMHIMPRLNHHMIAALQLAMGEDGSPLTFTAGTRSLSWTSYRVRYGFLHFGQFCGEAGITSHGISMWRVLQGLTQWAYNEDVCLTFKINLDEWRRSRRWAFLMLRPCGVHEAERRWDIID